jgi:hypothetical protein
LSRAVLARVSAAAALRVMSVTASLMGSMAAAVPPIRSFCCAAPSPTEATRRVLDFTGQTVGDGVGFACGSSFFLHAQFFMVINGTIKTHAFRQPPPACLAYVPTQRSRHGEWMPAGEKKRFS